MTVVLMTKKINPKARITSFVIFTAKLSSILTNVSDVSLIESIIPVFVCYIFCFLKDSSEPFMFKYFLN